MNFFYEIKDASYRNCHLIIFGLIILLLLILLFVVNLNKNTNNALRPEENYQNINDNKLVLYYASWCGWSQKFLPVWKQFQEQHPEIITDTIECTNNNKCTTIQGYPTIIYYKNGQPRLYNGDRSLDDLYKFVQNQINENKDDTNYNKDNIKTKLVLYHAEWCGHCKNFLPVWKQFVQQHPEISTEDIECSNDANKSKCANIEGFPTVVLIKDNQQIKYNGERTIDGLYNFVQNN
jgi:thiol-disulfide isomerase/thioredoxin